MKRNPGYNCKRIRLQLKFEQVPFLLSLSPLLIVSLLQFFIHPIRKFIFFLRSMETIANDLERFPYRWLWGIISNISIKRSENRCNGISIVSNEFNHNRRNSWRIFPNCKVQRRFERCWEIRGQSRRNCRSSRVTCSIDIDLSAFCVFEWIESSSAVVSSLTSNHSEILSNSLIVLLKHDIRWIGLVKQRLFGCPLPSSLRQWIWTECLLRFEKKPTDLHLVWGQKKHCRTRKKLRFVV